MMPHANISFLAVSNPTSDLLLLFALILPAWLMASIDSPFLLSYILAAWAFGPEIRRLNDWIGGEYQNVTVLSLIPLAATASLLIPVIRYYKRIPPPIRIGVSLILAALAYGTILGLVINGVPGLIEGLTKFLPFLVVPYAASMSYAVKLRDSWLRSFLIFALVTAGYAWYQYLNAPAWDMFWMMESRMFGSMGKPEPMGFRVFSSLNDAGSYGLFLAMSVIIGFCHRKLLGAVALPCIFVLISAMLLTQVRLSWGAVALGIGSSVALAKGTNRWLSMGGVILLVVVFAFVLPMLPGGEVIYQRMDSVKHLDSDNSAGARLNLLSSANLIISNPMGRGFGTTGVGGKLVDKDAVAAGMDNGYLDLCSTLGLPMTILLLSGIFQLGKWSIFASVETNTSSKVLATHRSIAVAVLAAYAGCLLFFNILGGALGFLLWLALACPLSRQEAFSNAFKGDSVTRRRQRLVPLRAT